MNIIMIGSDIEAFVFDNKLRKYVPAAEVIGTKYGKDNPMELSNGVGMHYDNLALEIQTRPADGYESFIKNHTFAINGAQKFIQSINEHLSLRFIPVAHFDKLALTHPTAHEFYCSRDYNLLNIKRKVNPAQLPYRAAGGHIHITYGMDFDPVPCLPMIVYMVDYLVSANLLKNLPYRRLEAARRSVYGSFSSYRKPDHGGVEIRSPSNLWCSHPLWLKTTAHNLFSIPSRIGNQAGELMYQSKRMHRFMTEVAYCIETKDTLPIPQQFRIFNLSGYSAYRINAKRKKTRFSTDSNVLSGDYVTGSTMTYSNPFTSQNTTVFLDDVT